MTKNIIPFFFTSLNLISGCIAVYFVFSSQFLIVFYFLILGIFFDFLDGFFARILDSETELGVQFDSMADVITSGFLPGVILSQMFILNGNYSTVIDLSFFVDEKIEFIPLSLCGFILTIAAVNRLANFNLKSNNNNQKDFKGLPAPAMAIFFGSLPLLIKSPSFLFLKPILLSNITLIIWSLNNLTEMTETKFAIMIVFLVFYFLFTLLLHTNSKKGELEDFVLGIIQDRNLVLLLIVLLVSFYYVYFN